MNDVVTPMSLDEIMGLRIAVLRIGTPVTTCDYPEDLYDDVVHLGIRRNGTVIGTSTWFAKECPEALGETAMHLKGMALDTHRCRHHTCAHSLDTTRVGAGTRFRHGVL